MDFDTALAQHELGPLQRGRVTTLQVNVGKRCNQACHHCHVEAGPKRTEVMTAATVDGVLALIARSRGIEVVDVTGGAPELNPSFRRLVTEARRLGARVIDRCNLTILCEPGMEGLAEFLAAERVEIIASLPCYQAENVEKQRGRGVFDRSIEALRRLNALGYGLPSSPLRLDLVYNPLGPFLSPPQAALEQRYKTELRDRFAIDFHHLLTITNMPIRRFAQMLHNEGRYDSYLSLLVNHFNPRTVPELMCRSLVSVGWDGRLYDCDFNQMLEIDLAGSRSTVWDVESLDVLAERRIATGAHCFGCTAGAGSSCGGSLS